MSEFDQYYNILKNQTTNQLGLYLFCCSISIVWTVYIMFFNSRLFGHIITVLVNLFIKRFNKNDNVWVKVGSFSISLLSGKIMFRSLHYVTLDYTLYIQDGWITFAYWRPNYIIEDQQQQQQLNPDQASLLTNQNETTSTQLIKNISKKKVARLEIYLSNMQLHYYNSFKLNNDLITTTTTTTNNTTTYLTTAKLNEQNTNNSPLKDYIMSLFSIVNIKIEKGKIYAGNKTLPTILSLKFSSSKMELVTETSQSKLDDGCYIVSGDVSKLEISLLQQTNNHNNSNNNNNNNNKTTEPIILPPQPPPPPTTTTNRDNRVLLLRSVALDFKYIQDIPSILTFDRRRVQKTLSGDFIHLDKEPQWSLTINCLKQTVINYGPWYDRQREHLWKFFFPQTYETLEPQPSPTLNEKRQTSKFDFYLNLKEQSSTELNLLFSSATAIKSNDTNANIQDRKLTFKCKSDSSFMCSIPWLTKKNGYKTIICGTFNSVQSYTNMSFKHFLCAETFKLNIEVLYPLIWNDLQTWNINLDFLRATAFLLYHHKYFFQDLINDWSSRTVADIRTYVPYIYNLNANIEDIELILPCNQHNWIDTNNIENNSFLAILAHYAKFNTAFNFEDFMPEKSQIKFEIQAEEACARFIIPETNTNLILLKLLRKNLKYISDNGIKQEFNSNRWSKFNSDEYYLNDYDKKTTNVHFKENWIECGQSKSVFVAFSYTYHSCYLLDWNETEYSPTVKMLSKLNVNSTEFDCEQVFAPDRISVQIELGPVILLLYGTFLKRLWYVKEGYFSWDQLYTEMKNEFSQKEFDNDVTPTIADLDKKDARNFRPLSIDVSLAIHNIQGHLVLDSTGDPFPIGFTRRLCLELDKHYTETRLQLYVDPINLFLIDSVKRSYDKNLMQGHLCLSSLQVRGHAMFSDSGRIKTDTLEYAWLLEILLGDVTGYITPVHSEQIFHFLETFLNLILENEYDLRSVYKDRVDPGLPYKYCVTRFSLDKVDVCLVECGTALSLLLQPIRLSLCNSHTWEYAKGLSVYIEEIKLKQYVNEASRNEYRASDNGAVSSSLIDTTRSNSQNSKQKRNKKIESTTTEEEQDNDNITISSLNSSYSSLLSIINNKKQKTTTNEPNHQKEDNNGTHLNKNNKNNNYDKKENNSSSFENLQQDSDLFNYWLECSAIQTGPIMLDTQLEKGNPAEQLKFLRKHDERTKRLYFLWDTYMDYYKSTYVDNQNNNKHVNQPFKCGCIGGCYFYSVVNAKGIDDFFKAKEKLTRLTPYYAQSLFHPDHTVLNSQDIMREKHVTKEYNYDVDKYKDIRRELPKRSKSRSPANILSSSQPKLNIRKQKSKTPSIRTTVSIKSLKMSEISLNQPSTKVSSQDNNDDYYTADEEENSSSSESENKFNTIKRRPERPNKLSLNTADNSSVIIKMDEDDENENYKDDDNHGDNDDDDDDDGDNDDSDGDLSDIEHELTGNGIGDDNESSDYDTGLNSRLTLRFDIKKPILDSILPKYCYLKYLSRAYVTNWNRTFKYPYFNEFKDNITFVNRSDGFNCSLLKVTHASPITTTNNSSNTSSANSSFKTKNKDKHHHHEQQQQQQQNEKHVKQDNQAVKCRVNLCFSSNIECYITPLTLTGLERYANALRSYEIHPHTLLTELDTNAQAHCASNSIIQAISRTHVSLKIPQIRVCSLQVGLSEDKMNTLIETLVSPDELVTLSLFTICFHNIDTQFIDTHDSTAAIFKINKIDTQFRRLHTIDQHNSQIKLSCISNERSKVSFDCFNQDEKTNHISLSSGSIMYECAFEQISIKAIKRSTNKQRQHTSDKISDNESDIDEVDDGNNDNQNPLDDTLRSLSSTQTLTSTSTQHSDKTVINEPGQSQDDQLNSGTYNNGRISLCEFEITKIWFSFPEPPISPKGKRKIPYNRYEWNLLSSISPAVISWLCASKHLVKSFKLYLNKYNKNLMKIFAVLLSGSLKHHNELIQTVNKIHQQNQYFIHYLTQSSQLYNKDPNCRLTKLLRLYLFTYNREIEHDLNVDCIPDTKYLKRACDGVLKRWANELLVQQRNYNIEDQYRYITEIRHVDKQQQHLHNLLFTSPIQTQTNPRTNQNEPTVAFVNTTTTNQNNSMLNSSNPLTMDNLSTAYIYNAKLNSSNHSTSAESINIDRRHSSIISNTSNKSNVLKSPELQYNSKIEFNLSTGKTQSGLSHQADYKKLQSGHAGPLITVNTNLVFKPILSFIGIDLPSGTIVDNLFKEFGSVLIGNLNIKSVDVNILGNVVSSTTNTFTAMNTTVTSMPSNSRASNISANQFNPNINYRNRSKVKLNENVIRNNTISNSANITTILSFDGLLLNINIRQVIPEQQQKTNDNEELINDPSSIRRKSTIKQINPITINVSRTPKYYTKIDTGIQLNNLTQEINTPLLRLAHQLYSIVADAIEYDKENDYNNLTQSLQQQSQSFENSDELIRKTESKLSKKTTTSIDENICDEESIEKKDAVNNEERVKPRRKHQYQPSNQSINKDCWTFIDSIVQLDSFVPELKYVEKINEINKNDTNRKMRKSYVHVTKNTVDKDQNIISFFGWININEIKSTAGIGTLMFNGDMKNVQLSILFGKKMDSNGTNKKQYEGSLNVRMGSTSGILAENDLGRSNETDLRNVIVSMTVGESHTFCFLKKLHLNAILSSLIHIGKISIDVPLRPMDVHSVVIRQSKEIEQQLIPEFRNFVAFDNTNDVNANLISGASADASGNTNQRVDNADENSMNVDGDPKIDINQASNLKKTKRTKSNDNLRQARRTPSCTSVDKKQATKFYFDLKTKLDGCDIKAKLLETPCLTAAYKLGNIELYTTIAQKSKLSCTLHKHCLSFECDDFNSQQQQQYHQQQQNRQQVSTYLNLSHSYSDSMKKSQQQQTNPITRKTDFDLPGVKVDGTYYSKIISELNKQVNLTDLKLNVNISQLCHELNAEVIAQLVFVAKVFIKEINHILQAVYSYNFNNTTIQTNVQHQRVRGSSATIKLQPQIFMAQQQQQQLQQQQSTAILSRIYYNIQIEVGKISLTAITPSHTSLNICNGDKTIVFLTNVSQTAKESINKKSASRKTKSYSHQAISNQDYTIKPFIEAKCHICIDLKTCFKQNNNDLFDLNKQQTQPTKGASATLNVPLQQSSPHSKSGIGLINQENESDWYQLALFDTKFDLRNEINLNDDKETIIINVDKPRFYLQPGAIDNSLSFYLNYKSTYDFWLDKRQQFANIFVDKNQYKNLTTKNTKQASTPTTNPGGGADSLVLMLKLSVKNLGLALPLSNKMTKDFKTNTDCLIITLDDTSLDAYYSDCVVTRGKFNNFCLRFAENLDLTSSNWLPIDMIKINSNTNKNQRIFDGTGRKSKVIFNSWIVPYGSYKICSSTIHSLLDSVKHNRDVTNRPIWNLSVVWNMEGIDVNLDTSIGKWFSKFAATITRLTETQYTTEDPNQSKERETEIRVLKNKLQYYKDCGDEDNANEIRLKIDRIVLANYPDKLKKTLAKTRDNFKGQLGFTTAAPSPSVNKSKNVSTQQNSQLNYNNTMAEKELNALNLQPSSSHHARSKSDVYFKKGHSISNEDTKLDSINENRFTTNSTQDEKMRSVQTTTTNEELARSSNTQLAQSVDIKLDVRIDINSGRCVFHNTIASVGSSPKSDRRNDHHHNKQNRQQHSRLKSTSSTTSSGSAVSNNSTSIIDDYYYYQFENHSNHDQNKNTVFIFPAICVKAYYDESTNTEQNSRLFKRANLYSIIKIEKFAIPTNQTANVPYAFYNKSSTMKEMVISPALLDFLEQTLEPLDSLLKSHTNNELNKKRVKTSKVNNDRSRTVSFNNTKTIINDNTNNNNGENEHIEFDLNSANEDNEDDITEFSDSDEDESYDDDDDDTTFNQNNIDNDDTSIDKNETLKPSNKSRNRTRIKHKKNKKASTTTSPPITTIHFPIDFVVIISMLPSDIRFTCTPSSMECLFKLPSIEMVFSSKSHRSVQLLQQQQSLQLNELDEDSSFDNLNKETKHNTTTTNNNNNNYKSNNKILKLNNNDNNSSAGLSVTCCLSDLSIIFYNRLGIKTSTDTKYIKSDERHYDEKDSLSVRVGYIKLNICRTHRLIENTITNNNPCHDVKLSVIADIGGSSFTYGIRNIKEVFVFPKYWYRSSLARRLFLGEESSTQTATESGGNINNDNSGQSGQNNSNNKNPNEINKRILKKQKYKSDHQLNVHDWKTLVLISINLAELEVKMNFGNVLGDVTWVSKKAKSASKIAINSHGKRKMEFNFILDYSKLTSDGSTNPIVLRIQDISSFVTFDDEDLDLKSPHRIDLNIYAIECTIGSTFNPTTYMMGCRLSNLCAKLNDVRNPRNAEHTNSEAFVDFNEEERNFASSSSAENKPEISPEEESKLRKILLELCVSWDQFHLMITSSTTSDLIVLYYRLYEYIEKQFAEGKDYIKSWDLDLFYEVKTKQFNSPNEKTKQLNKRNFYVPGGNIRLNGNNFTLITFSGTNFKVKQWAIFSLNEPSLDFCVDKEIIFEDEKYVTYPEELFFNLGLNNINPERTRTNKSGQNLASIYIVSRESSSLITQLHTINDWFEYAHYGIDAFGLRDFPRFYTDLEHTQEVKKLKITEQIKYDEVFHIPSLNIYFTSTLIKNVVKFRLNVTFHDHILTTYSVQNFHFLYQLITQYMNERKRIEVKQPIPSSTDGRTFECLQWELDPTLKLISKYGSMDSFGIDSLLKNLGVKHAKITIPKWLQAGLMDSANDLLQNIIKAYVKVVPDEQ